MTDSHIRANEWTTQVAPPRRSVRTFSVARTLRAAAIAGYELKRNQVDRLWYWQAIASTRLDWRGTGYRTKADAVRAFDDGSDAQ